MHIKTKKEKNMKSRKSWREKLNDSKDLPKVINITGKMIKRWGTGTCAIPSPKEVDTIMKKIPRGKVTTINNIREMIAKKHHATIGCPIVTGIAAMISAHAAVEDEKEGKNRITPYWRTLKLGGELNPKYPGGIDDQKKKLESEGHKIIRKGEKCRVEDYEKSLINEIKF
jgi:alkylated DNA nucleotide flippase Atl1